MNKIPVTHVGSLPRTQEVVDLIFARENGQPFDQDEFDTVMTYAVSATVKKQVDAGVDQEIYYGQKAQLDATVSNGGMFEWTPGYYLDDSFVEDPLSEPEETTSFVLRVTSDNGCETLDTIVVYVNDRKKIRVPTAFTPNNDSKNDRYLL